MMATCTALASTFSGHLRPQAWNRSSTLLGQVRRGACRAWSFFQVLLTSLVNSSFTLSTSGLYWPLGMPGIMKPLTALSACLMAVVRSAAFCWMGPEPMA